jgi:hypothetical protein
MKNLWKITFLSDSRSGNRWMATLLTLILFAASGCGGGGGGGTGGPTTPTRTPVRITVQWGNRSRSVNPPSSALSGELKISGNGVEVTLPFNRDTNRTDSYTEQYSTTQEVQSGNYSMNLRFFSEVNNGGVLVSQTNTPVTVQSNGDIGTVSLTNTVRTVQITPGQNVEVGQQKALSLTARDSQGNIVPVGSDDGTISVVSGQDKLTVVGDQVRGIAPGLAQVQVRVDGITSSSESIGVGGVAVALGVTGLRSSSPVAIRQGGATTFQTVSQSQTHDFTLSWFSNGQITVPGGYGDRQFVKWTLNGGDFSTLPTLDLSASNFGGGALTAIFEKRNPTSNQFFPNYYQNDYPRWAGGQFALRVYFEPHNAADSAMVSRLFNNMKKWEQATGGVLSYVLTNDVSQAHIRVRFGTIPQNPQAGGATTLSLDGATGEIFEADITLNESLLVTTAGRTALETVATHEFGHALGMTNRSQFSGANNGHSSDANDTMFPTGNPQVSQITERDMNTLSTIYLNELTRSRSTTTTGTRSVPTKLEKLTVTCGVGHAH